MQISLNQSDGSVRFVVRGEIDAFDTENLNRSLLRKVARGNLTVVVDLSGATSIDPSLGALLVEGHTALQMMGGSLHVVLPKDILVDFESTGRSSRSL